MLSAEDQQIMMVSGQYYLRDDQQSGNTVNYNILADLMIPQWGQGFLMQFPASNLVPKRHTGTSFKYPVPVVFCDQKMC
jgi:hypothetical protein